MTIRCLCCWIDSWKCSPNGFDTAQDNNHYGFRLDYNSTAVRYQVRRWRSPGFLWKEKRSFKKKMKANLQLFFSFEASSSAVIDSSHVFLPQGWERCWVSLSVIVKLVYSRGATNPSDPLAPHNYRECNYKTGKHSDTLGVSVLLLAQTHCSKSEGKDKIFILLNLHKAMYVCIDWSFWCHIWKMCLKYKK